MAGPDDDLDARLRRIEALLLYLANVPVGARTSWEELPSEELRGLGTHSEPYAALIKMVALLHQEVRELSKRHASLENWITNVFEAADAPQDEDAGDDGPRTSGQVLFERQLRLERRIDGVELDVAAMRGHLGSAEKTLGAAAWALELGADYASIEALRMLPVRLYVDADDCDVSALSKTIERLLVDLGWESATEFPAESGSWYKRWWARTLKLVTRDQVTDRLERLERAISVQTLNRPQAEVDLISAEAAKTLIGALPTNVPTAAQVGSLLVISLPGKGFMTRTLTTTELIQLERNQDLLKDPATTLERLAELCRGDQIAAELDG